MKQAKKLKVFGLMTMLISMVFMVSSCADDDTGGGALAYGKVTGVVTDDLSSPLEGVTVQVDGSGITATPDGPRATTNSQGVYTLENISIGTHIITFTKADYQTVSVTVVAGKFNEEQVAEVSPKMEYAAAKIKGKVTDAGKGSAPLEGVTVSISSTQTTTTGSDGTFEIGNLPLADYTVTFTKDGYASIVKKVVMADFVDGIATTDVRMGGTEILRGLTIDDLKAAEKWYYNEYRGGRNAESYPHWDWACNYMCTMDFRGDWEEQNEGTTLRIRNNEDDRKNPADLEMFDSFVFGSKLITEDNYMMTLQIRTHSADEAAPAYYGVQVVDLAAADPKAEMVGDVRTYASENYTSVPVDLSKYIGKEVIIAIGTFRAQTGDYWKQLVLRRIAFAKEVVEGWGWLPGTAVEELDGWKMTQEMVRSTMPQVKSQFTGMSPIGGGRDNYVDAYRAWREVDHVCAEWSYMPLSKDPEVFPSEGYLIKTRGGNNVSTTVPESYFYAKFSIASGRNKMTLKTRNFSGTNATFFKVTAIRMDGTLMHLAPASNTAQFAEAAADGCWKFIHEAGGKGDPEGYADFVYDLSQFNGEDVMLTIGIFKGEENGDENKLVLRSITME